MNHAPYTRQRGAALLVALLIAALVTVTLTVMLQRQSAVAGIEWQLRETTQARRILRAAEDWALLILREDARRSVTDHLGEPWAIPLQEGRLADFLKSTADGAPTANDADSRAQDIWLSGVIVDADRRYNLLRLTVPTTSATQPEERALWLRVAAQAGLSEALAIAVADRFKLPPTELAGNAPPAPHQPPLSLSQLFAQLPELAPSAARLSALVVFLPQSTTININTADKPLLMALIPELDDARAERFMDLRRKAPWRDLNSATAAFVEKPLYINPTQAGVASRYFIIQARVRVGVDAPQYATRATELNMTTHVERLPQEDGVRVVRRDYGHALNGIAP